MSEEQKATSGRWIHPFSVTYRGTFFDTVTCPHCGFELKTSPR